MWELIKRERKRRKKANEGIGMQEWKEHFMELLGGMEERIVMGREGWKKRVEERKLEQEEVEKVLRKLKDRKAIEKQGIPSEVWKWGGKEVQKCVWEICREVWKGGGWPEQWERGEIISIVEKKEEEKTKDYKE